MKTSNAPVPTRSAVPVLLVALLLTASGAATLHAGDRAAGGVLVAPTRLVFEEGTRSGELTLIHSGTEPVSVRIETVHFRMTAEGRMVPANEAGDARWADPLLRFSPRRVELAPGERQVVRVLVRRPADLEPGEYRTHLLFRAVAASAERALARDPGVERVGAAVTPVFGVSIPVLVRHRVEGSRVRIDSASLTRDPARSDDPRLRVRLLRDGDSSVYGDLVVERIGSGGSEVEIAVARGLAVYTPNPERWVELALSRDPEPGERLRIRYLDHHAHERELASLDWTNR